MDYSFFIFLSSGLFLGWSLGANDAANIFGTAVGTKMVRFRTAAVIASVFVMLGAVFSGGGASTTLVELGAVNAIAGSFMCACAAALTVYWMVNSGIPVSTSQSIVGAIIGWNFYSGKETDYGILSQIVSTWILCPLLAGIIAILLYWLIRFWLKHSRIHLLRQDSYTRIALIITGAFGAYALGSNNIGNVMGVFVDANPLQSVSLKYLHLSGTQLLFLIGSLAVSVGIFTRSHKIMRTIGKKIMVMTPVAAWIVVISQSIVLFIFASQGLEQFLLSRGLPALPLVPVSSSQAVIGAVMGRPCQRRPQHELGSAGAHCTRLVHHAGHLRHHLLYISLLFGKCFQSGRLPALTEDQIFSQKAGGRLFRPPAESSNKITPRI